MTTNFEILIVGLLHIIYILNTHVKFCANCIYYLIHKPFFMHNFRLQELEISTFK